MSKTVVSIINQIECSYPATYVKVLGKLKSDPEMQRKVKTESPQDWVNVTQIFLVIFSKLLHQHKSQELHYISNGHTHL